MAPTASTLSVRVDLQSPGSLGERALAGGVAAMGNFDGVHRGHQALIAAARDLALRLGSEPLAVTFEPHPRAVLRPSEPLFRLTPPGSKQLILAAAGVERVAEIAFDMSMARLPPEAFVERVLCDRLAVRGIVVGRDFRFGQARGGDTELLAEIGLRRGFVVEAIDPVVDDGGAVSSGRIRDALALGRVAEANALLGYRWFVTDIVVQGDQRGRELGYPTANLALPVSVALRHGIYAVSVAWAGQTPWPAVASFGVRPTFGGGRPLLEAHVFDFAGNLYGRPLTVGLVEWLRPEARFDSIAALVSQIADDAAQARSILAAAGPGTPLDQAISARLVAGGGWFA